MAYLRCPSDPDDDRRRGAGFNQTIFLIFNWILINSSSKETSWKNLSSSNTINRYFFNFGQMFSCGCSLNQFHWSFFFLAIINPPVSIIGSRLGSRRVPPPPPLPLFPLLQIHHIIYIILKAYYPLFSKKEAFKISVSNSNRTSNYACVSVQYFS